jgi:hypothetical protein
MDNSNTAAFDHVAEDILDPTVSDEALEAASAVMRGAISVNYTCGTDTSCIRE